MQPRKHDNLIYNLGTMSKLTPSKIRFIKLGEKGIWEKWCLDNNAIRLGYDSGQHEESLNGDWEKVKKYWLNFRNGDKRVAQRDINQIRDFYELEEEDLWITFHQRKLYWCRASSIVEELEDGTRIRQTIGSWSNKDVNGNILAIENIDGRVTQVQNFRGTICKPKLGDYLVNKINGVSQPEVETAKENLKQLKESIKDLIRGLWWNDFELLVDLIFSNGGWQRISVLGKTEKDIDLDIFSPVTQKRAFVQIKSSAKLSDFENYRQKFLDYEQFDEMYFVVHSSAPDLKEEQNSEANIHLIDLDRIVDLVINSGLINWLITKRM